MATKTKACIVRCIPNLQDATRIAAIGFAKPKSPELELDVHQHLADGDLVYSVLDSERIVGFAIFNVWDEVLYLSGVILDPEYQGRDLLAELVRRAREDAPEVTVLALRTQSVLMYLAARAVCTSWHPHPNATMFVPASQASVPMHSLKHLGLLSAATTRRVTLSNMPALLVQAAETVAARIGSTFPVTQGYYNGPLYGSKPAHTGEVFGEPKEALLQQWWDDICDFERGDAVLCVGKLTSVPEYQPWPGGFGCE